MLKAVLSQKTNDPLDEQIIKNKLCFQSIEIALLTIVKHFSNLYILTTLFGVILIKHFINAYLYNLY